MNSLFTPRTPCSSSLILRVGEPTAASSGSESARGRPICRITFRQRSASDRRSTAGWSHFDEIRRFWRNGFLKLCSAAKPSFPMKSVASSCSRSTPTPSWGKNGIAPANTTTHGSRRQGSSITTDANIAATACPTAGNDGSQHTKRRTHWTSLESGAGHPLEIACSGAFCAGADPRGKSGVRQWGKWLHPLGQSFI